MEVEADQALRAELRGSALDAMVSSHFDTRLIRRWRLQSARGTATYWMPAFVGGSLTAIAFLLMLYFLTAPAAIQRMPFGKDDVPLSRNDGSIRIPNLDFDERTLVR